MTVGQSSAQITRLRNTGGVSLAPSHIDTLFLQARPDEALEALKQVMGPQDTVHASLLYNRGLAERINGLGTGLVWFRKAYEADPSLFLVSWGLGTALTDEGLLVEGERYLREAVKLDKNYYESSVELGRNLRLQGRHEESVEAIQKAFGRNRTYAPAYTELAASYLAMNRVDLALETLQQGYDKFPYAEILLALVSRHMEGGDSSSAQEFAREYLTLYPKGEGRQQMISFLREVNPDADDHWPEEYHSHHLDNGSPYVDPETVIPAGIRFDYRVHWGIVTVGHLQIDVIVGEFRGEPAWEARYIATSAPGLPFVTISDTFYAWIKKDLNHVPLLEMRYDEKDFQAIKTYISDYSIGQFSEFTRMGNGYWEHTTHPLPPHVFDASSQLWIAQQLILKGISGTATVELSGGFEKTIITHRGKGPKYKMDGVATPTIRVDGIMRYAGIAGMTGDFEGLYSNDKRAWPLQARFKIFFGWVTLDYLSHQPSEMKPGFGIIR